MGFSRKQREINLQQALVENKEKNKCAIVRLSRNQKEKHKLAVEVFSRKKNKKKK